MYGNGYRWKSNFTKLWRFGDNFVENIQNNHWERLVLPLFEFSKNLQNHQKSNEIIMLKN